MSQQQEPSQQQPTVRHIPIYVEGRSEPLVNTSPESQPSAHHHQSSSQPSAHHAHHHPSHPQTGMESPGMDMPSQNDFFKQNSIFDRVRDIPVRSNFSNQFFKREPSPCAHRTSPFADMGSHMPHTNVPHRGSSIPRQTPSPPTTNSGHSQTQQKPTQPSNAYQQQYAPQRQPPQQQQQSPQPQPQPQHHPEAGYDLPDSRPKQSFKEDPIFKIQKIQKDVLAIFDQVEKFRGTKEGKKDKAYIYLDEMLTQNLLKLDSIDAEDQPQIKSARKEAIKSINTCIAVLEQKAEAGALESGSNASSSSLGGRNDSSNGIDTKAGVNGVEQQQQQQSAANRSASNTSITHSSSNSSQQQPQ
ncbi:BAG domain-containing protein Samui [Anopheles darlingi]|uniref:BAG domain-containing protein Samui n=1 Tax=Anopheles darlingi TaxID=43151 RepID=UPI0021000F94|nr:BAG domain-containing protein Samui [Anopheles darlingi]